MNFSLSSLSNFFDHVDTNIKSVLILDGVRYEMNEFNMTFGQAVDWKGQPQHEVRGGQFTIILSELPSPSVYDWAKRSNRAKSGQIVFQTETRGTILDIKFEEGHCVSFIQNIDYINGTRVKLSISAQKLELNGRTFSNI